MKPEIDYGWWWSIKCSCCVKPEWRSYAKKCYRRALRRFYKKNDKRITKGATND